MSNTNVLVGRATTSAVRRINALDVARGIAILGTLWTNIWLFTHPYGLAGLLLDAVPSTQGKASALFESGLLALSQGKFLALLTLMFGMGLAIQHTAAARRGARWPGRYLWRAALLFADGIINYVLIAEFDVLMGYAVTAAIVSTMLLTSERAQRRLIAGFATAHVLLFTAIAGLVALSPGGEPRQWEGHNPYADGSFWGLAMFRIDNLVIFRAEPVMIGLLSIAMFLLGAQLFRAGVFTADGARVRRRLLVIGAVAWPVDLALGVFGGTAGMLLERYVAAPLVALALLALIAEGCLRWGTDGWIARRLREVGRTALTCYLLQNLIAGAIFYGWGLGLAADLGDWRVPATVLGYLLISAIIVVFAHLWLRRFRLGPVEWVWKRAGDVRLTKS